MKAYLQQINITETKRVIVSGQLSRTNLSVKLNEMISIAPPIDGIWNYELEVLPTSMYGAAMMVPFSVEASWIGDNDANGIRILQPSIIPGEEGLETVQLKGKKVKNFTSKQSNSVLLEGAFYNKATSHLVVDINYSGGCFQHHFALEWDGLLLESYPPQYNFNLVDLSDYDPCRAIKRVQLRFDISTPDFQIERPSTINLGTPSNNKIIRIELES